MLVVNGAWYKYCEFSAHYRHGNRTPGNSYFNYAVQLLSNYYLPYVFWYNYASSCNH